MKDALLGTWPGRLVVIGVVIRVLDLVIARMAGALPVPLAVLDYAAAIAIIAGGVLFLARGLTFLRKRLLWRVRRKLIISYVFIGFIPAALIVAFFFFGAILLFFNFGAYLVRSEFRTLTANAQNIAHDIVREIERSGRRDAAEVLRTRAVELAADYPGISLAIVRTHRECGDDPTAQQTVGSVSGLVTRAGPWSHLDPPSALPDWIVCSGISDVFVYSSDRRDLDPRNRPAGGRLGGAGLQLQHGHPLVRAVAMPESASPTYAVIVDVVVDASVRRRLRDATGVEVESVQLINQDVEVLPGRPSPEPPPGDAAPRFTSIAYLPSRNWSDGKVSAMTASVRLGIGDMYRRISATPEQVGNANIVLYILAVVGGLFLIIEILALTTGLVLARSITGSVHELFTGTERVRQGDFSHKIAVAADDQLGELAQSFNSMTASIEDLLRDAAEKKRLEEELRIAHEIQMSLLPQNPPRIPGLAMTALCVPAREIGGDYYDLLPLDNDRLGVLIADVSGKGTSAALYMAELKGLVLSLSRSHTSPRGLLIEADRTLATQLDARSFITITYAVIDMRARTMTFARAGHTPLIHVPGHASTERARARFLVPNGLVLGLKIDDGSLFERLLEEKTIALTPGDLFVFFTDGITEAMNTADDFFGDQRLGQIIEDHGHLPPDELRERILREVSAFVGDAPQHDDMTMILLKVEATG